MSTCTLHIHCTCVNKKMFLLHVTAMHATAVTSIAISTVVEFNLLKPKFTHGLDHENFSPSSNFTSLLPAL